MDLELIAFIAIFELQAREVREVILKQGIHLGIIWNFMDSWEFFGN